MILAKTGKLDKIFAASFAIILFYLIGRAYSNWATIQFKIKHSFKVEQHELYLLIMLLILIALCLHGLYIILFCSVNKTCGKSRGQFIQTITMSSIALLVFPTAFTIQWVDQDLTSLSHFLLRPLPFPPVITFPLWVLVFSRYAKHLIYAQTENIKPYISYWELAAYAELAFISYVIFFGILYNLWRFTGLGAF